MTLLRACTWLALISGFVLASTVYAVLVWWTVFPAANKARRKKLLHELGVINDDRSLAGLFHPYWYAAQSMTI